MIYKSFFKFLNCIQCITPIFHLIISKKNNKFLYGIFFIDYNITTEIADINFDYTFDFFKFKL